MKKLLLITSGILVISSYSTPAQAWHHHYGWGLGWGAAPLFVERGPVVVERSPIIVEPDPVVHNSRVDRIDELNRRIAHLENDKALHPENTREDNIEIHAIRKEIHRLYG